MSVETAYHHRWLRRPVSTYWWLERRSYFAFILREGSCMFVGWFVVYLLLLMRASLQGEASYQGFLAWSATPGILLINVVSLGFMLFHAITFFVAAPQAMVVHVGHKRVPARLVLVAHYVAWVVASGVIAWLLLAGNP
jgi:fumarate reductase subunit C